MNARPLILCFVFSLCLSIIGCDSGNPIDADEPPADAESRSYRMGWFVNAPRPTDAAIIATIDSMSNVADMALLQENPPWERLFDGASIDELAAEKGDVADFLRANGMEVAYLVDPLDGLNRRSEPSALVAAERSIMESEIRTLHEEWVRAVAREVQPRWMGLASEINTLGQHGDADLYERLVDVINGLASEIRAISPETEVFVSFQVEDTWGLHGPSQVEDPFALISDFDIDVLGLSSYPVFTFDTPADVPDDHFRRFRDATDRPLALVEGGWSSASGAWAEADPAEQRQYIRRYEELLDGIEATMWIGLLYADLDVEALGLPPDREETLLNFARMGIADENLQRKPSYAEWKRIFDRPLE